MQYKNLLRILLVVCLSVFFVSCSQDAQDTEIFVPYLDDNILEGQEYIPYEKVERESEGIGDDYFLVSPTGYNCDNIKEFGRFSGLVDISVSPEFSNRFCDDWKTYRGHKVISFVYYDSGYESLPKLGYKMLFFHPEKGYIDYIIPEDQLDFNHYADIQVEHIEKKISEGAEFPNEKWGELYDYMEVWLKKDFTHDKDVAWIVEQERSLGEYIRKYSSYSWSYLSHPDLNYNCSNIFGLGHLLNVRSFRSDVCNMIEIGDRKLIYLLFGRGSYQESGYWITEGVYLIDNDLGYISLNLEDFQLSRFMPDNSDRYDVFGSGVVSVYDDGKLVGTDIVGDGISWTDLQKIDDKLLEEMYFNSPEIESEFSRLGEYVKEKYIKNN